MSGYTSICFDTLYVLTLAFVYALIEIEMEGKHGWAKNLPTTRDVIGRMTLYHVYMFVFVVLMFSGWFLSRTVSGCASGWHMVIQFLFFTVLWFLAEDFLWFVFNPHYTLKNYERGKIPWHRHWVSKHVPVHNVIGVLGLCLLAVANGNSHLWLALGVVAVCVPVCAQLAPAYHKFYVQTHRQYMS